MTPRAMINFFRSRTGAFIIFIVLLGSAYFLVNGFKKPRKNSHDSTTQTQEKREKGQIAEKVVYDMTAFNPPIEEETKAAEPSAPRKEQKNFELPPISLYAESAGSEKPLDPLDHDYAPFGRLIPCQLITTVDSSSIATPVIGVVSEDIWHNSQLIIPAGTEVHGSAALDKMRERIASTGNWTLVWQSGEELSLKGMALDREKEESGWAITDGSAGLRGQLIKSDNLAEIKLFTATFLSGAADALTEKEETIFGSRTTSSLKNAPFKGAQEILNLYAQQVLSSIQRDGFYIRVAAGKQFYLYVTQTIDRSKAIIGSSRAINVKEESVDKLNSSQIQRSYAPNVPPMIVTPPELRIPSQTSTTFIK